MKDTTLGQILVNHQFIDGNCLVNALEQQDKFLQQSRWKLLGEILVESGDISREELWTALNRQANLFDTELFASHLHPSVQSKFKRSLDIFGAMAGLGISMLISPLVALAIALESPGPVLCPQYRVGLRGKQFKTWKFRTTTKRKEAQKNKSLSACLGSQVTRIGRFLRQTHIDELPQFINVLKGEMSLVGTRPPTLGEVKTYSKKDWQRLSIKPGLTGFWQTSKQRYNSDFNRVVKLDMTYVRRWRPLLDLKVIVKTITQILFDSQLDRAILRSASFNPVKVPILNVEVDNLSKIQLLRQLDNGVVYTPNVDHLMKLQHDQEFYRAYSQADYKPCDSQILVYASRFLGQPIQEKVSGSDLFPEFCQFHQNNDNIRIFLLGGAEDVAAKAQTRINSRIGRQIIVDAHSPSFNFVQDSQECEDIIEKINQCQPSVLAVCLGAPKQEKWIYQYKNQLPSVKIFLAVGATIDFEAGYKMRAPQWISNLGFEWLFRLVLEPRRMWKRYLFDDLPFIWLLLKQKLGLYKSPFVVHDRRHEYPLNPTLEKHFRN